MHLSEGHLSTVSTFMTRSDVCGRTFARSFDLQIVVQSSILSSKQLICGSSSRNCSSMDIGAYKIIAFTSARYGAHGASCRAH